MFRYVLSRNRCSCCNGIIIIYRFSHYDTLEVKSTASIKEIKQSYYKLSKKYHPDVNKNKDAEEKFKKIQSAYQVLGDEDKKLEYDRNINSNDRFGRHPNTSHSSHATPGMNVFRARSTHVHTGNTSTYNFDEYYKMHYYDMMKRRHAEILREKAYWDKMRHTKREKEMEKELSKHVWLRLLSLLLSFFLMGFLALELNRDEEHVIQERLKNYKKDR